MSGRPLAFFTNMDINTLLLSVILPGMGYGLKLLKDARDHLAILNGRVGRAEQWRDDHERLHDRLHTKGD